jgi:hypothetical protein
LVPGVILVDAVEQIDGKIHHDRAVAYCLHQQSRGGRTMTSPQAILTGAALIALAVVLSNGSLPVTAGSDGRYAVVAPHQAAVYQWDTDTGAIRGCYPADGKLKCFGWTER